jgi:hypothetical protein
MSPGLAGGSPLDSLLVGRWRRWPLRFKSAMETSWVGRFLFQTHGILQYPPISSKIWMIFFGILQRFLHFDVLLENHLNFDGSAIVHFVMDLDLPA